MLEWSNSDPNTYVIVKQGTNVNQLNHKIKGFLKSKDHLISYRFISYKIFRQILIWPI